VTAEFEAKIKNYLFKVPCGVCNDFLFLLHMKKIDEKRATGTVYCPTCERKSETYFYR